MLSHSPYSMQIAISDILLWEVRSINKSLQWYSTLKLWSLLHHGYIPPEDVAEGVAGSLLWLLFVFPLPERIYVHLFVLGKRKIILIYIYVYIKYTHTYVVCICICIKNKTTHIQKHGRKKKRKVTMTALRKIKGKPKNKQIQIYLDWMLKR